MKNKFVIVSLLLVFILPVLVSVGIYYKPENFKKAVILTSNKLNWEIKNMTNDYAVAVRNGNFLGGSWGELVTIIRKKNIVLINSICDPDNIISVASWGWNKKNIETFKMSLENIVNEDLKNVAIKNLSSSKFRNSEQ